MKTNLLELYLSNNSLGNLVSGRQYELSVSLDMTSVIVLNVGLQKARVAATAARAAPIAR